MGDEQLQVLQMVSAGTITPEQGEELLAALAPAPAPPSGTPQRRAAETSDWGDTRASKKTLTRLSEARLHGVTPEFIRSLADVGYSGLSLETYIELRTHGVTADYIRQMRDGGFSDLSLHELVELRVSGINPEYVRDMVGLGLGEETTTLPSEEPSSIEPEQR